MKLAIIVLEPCSCETTYYTLKKALVITPGDRADIILGALQANESQIILRFQA
jgi:BioD-like phosphotransacetylase family protein